MYRWKPNASYRRSFVIKMSDPEEKQAYEERKRAKSTYSDDPRSFKFKSFVPTLEQWRKAGIMIDKYDLSNEEKDAALQVFSGYSSQDKISHDYIHIVNHFIIV